MEMKPKLLTTANQALYDPALPTSSLPLPSSLPPTYQAGPASEHSHLLFPLPGLLVFES